MLLSLFLSQSAYFQSMFNGSWKESTADHITMEIPDENIDVEGNITHPSLLAAFASANTY